MKSFFCFLIFFNLNLYANNTFTKYFCHPRNQLVKQDILDKEFIRRKGDHHCDWTEYLQTSSLTICTKKSEFCEYECRITLEKKIVRENMTCL